MGKDFVDMRRIHGWWREVVVSCLCLTIGALVSSTLTRHAGQARFQSIGLLLTSTLALSILYRLFIHFHYSFVYRNRLLSLGVLFGVLFLSILLLPFSLCPTLYIFPFFNRTFSFRVLAYALVDLSTLTFILFAAGIVIMKNRARLFPTHSPLHWLIILILAANWYSGFRGINFGDHWDEGIQIDLITQSVRNRSLLPSGFYNYPSVTYWLTLLSNLPNVARLYTSGDPGWIDPAAAPALDLLPARSLFVVASSLTVLWLYIGSSILKRKPLEALLASAFLGFSWEFAYHQRWIAPDAILASLGALVFLFLALAYTGRRRVWFYVAAAAAGIAASTKYPGGLLLIPVLALYVQLGHTSRRRRDVIYHLVGQAVTFVVAFVLFTPGIVYEPKVFFNQVQTEIWHYAQGGHSVYTVSPGAEHFFLILEYFLAAAFSSYSYFAIAICFAALVGIYSVIRTGDHGLWIVYLLFPATYLFYFSFQRVMIARNLLVLFPFVAVLIAEGIAFLYRRQKSWRRSAFAFLVAVMLVFNLGWLIYAAESIPAYDEAASLRQLAQYIERHPNRTFYVQASAAERFGQARVALPENAGTGGVVKGDYLVLFGTDVWRANNPFAITAMFGPFDVNFGMYPRWAGPSRYVIIPNVQAIGIYHTWDFE